MALSDLRQAVASRVVGLIQRHGSKRVKVAGRQFVVNRDVFNPKYFQTSELFARHLEQGAGLKSGEAVLDVGTGSGILAIVAAASAGEVVAVDVNPAAVACARDNGQRNGVSNLTVYEGDLFAPLPADARFDLILFNPPYLEGEARNPFELALYDPGGRVIERFLGEAAGYLRPGGRVLMIYSTIAAPDRLSDLLAASSWKAREVARQRTPFETYVILELR